MLRHEGEAVLGGGAAGAQDGEDWKPWRWCPIHGSASSVAPPVSYTITCPSNSTPPLFGIVFTIHVSTATTKRAFSAMNIIKNKLRSKMGDEYLGDCMVLHIEKEYAESVTNEEVIKEFEASSTRRVKFS
ncbi:hypothetical protein ACLB2K_072807 [Fragaria x ananassa]